MNLWILYISIVNCLVIIFQYFILSVFIYIYVHPYVYDPVRRSVGWLVGLLSWLPKSLGSSTSALLTELICWQVGEWILTAKWASELTNGWQLSSGFMLHFRLTINNRWSNPLSKLFFRFYNSYIQLFTFSSPYTIPSLLLIGETNLLTYRLLISYSLILLISLSLALLVMVTFRARIKEHPVRECCWSISITNLFPTFISNILITHYSIAHSSTQIVTPVSSLLFSMVPHRGHVFWYFIYLLENFHNLIYKC